MSRFNCSVPEGADLHFIEFTPSKYVLQIKSLRQWFILRGLVTSHLNCYNDVINVWCKLLQQMINQAGQALGKIVKHSIIYQWFTKLNVTNKLTNRLI